MSSNRISPLRRMAKANRERREAEAFEEASTARAHEILSTLPRVPAKAPMSNFDFPETWRSRRCVCIGKRPDHRTIEVPFVQGPWITGFASVWPPRYGKVLFQSVEYSLEVTDETTITWWGWKPVEEAFKPEVRMGLQRGRHYALRLKNSVRDIKDLVREWRSITEWLDIVIEDASQNLGEP